MSNLDRTPGVTLCGGRTAVAARPVQQLIPGREVWLGESTRVRRLLPTLGRRMVGAWCFIDHYGPDDIAAEPGMQVPPHPHIGLQTVSWLLEGEVLHRDSLGNEQVIRPGELGLMTAGRAIAHAEQSPVRHPALLHGAQMWVALPDDAREVAPAWQHDHDPPAFTEAGLTGTLILGELGGAVSPGRTYSPLVGADLTLAAGARTSLPLEPDFEYAVLAASGFAEVDGTVVEPGALLYLGCGRRDLRLASEPGARLLLLGGEPFAEQIVMWWNFVARTGQEIAEARADWMRGSRFGSVQDYDGEPLAAPPLPATPLKPRRADG